MNWLFWKDYRENRLVVFAALFLLVTPHLFSLFGCCVQSIRWGAGPQTWIDSFTASSMFSLVISQLAVALIGGNAIAGERADRSAEFLASLPIARKKILTSKLLLSLAIVGVIWVTNASALFGLASWAHQFWNDPQPVIAALATLGCIAIVAMMLFGVSWLLSSFLSSPTFAVGGGLIIPLLLYAGICFGCYLLHLGDDRWMEERRALSCFRISAFAS